MNLVRLNECGITFKTLNLKLSQRVRKRTLRDYIYEKGFTSCGSFFHLRYVSQKEIVYF
jgi:hypothetical protein